MMFKNLWRVFQLGQEVIDPAKWKKGQITVNAVGALLYAVAQLSVSLGYEIPATSDQIDSLGIGLFALVNILLTITTSKRVGLPPRDSGVDEIPPDNGGRNPSRWDDPETHL